MRVIICGSRDGITLDDVSRAMRSSGIAAGDVSVVLSGCAQGADKHGERWAHNRDIPVEKYPADWEKYGRGAGPMRNIWMSKNADACVAVWDGQSKGTRHMMGQARARGLILYVHRVD